VGNLARQVLFRGGKSPGARTDALHNAERRVKLWLREGKLTVEQAWVLHTELTEVKNILLAKRVNRGNLEATLEMVKDIQEQELRHSMLVGERRSERARSRYRARTGTAQQDASISPAMADKEVAAGLTDHQPQVTPPQPLPTTKRPEPRTPTPYRVPLPGPKSSEDGSKKDAPPSGPRPILRTRNRRRTTSAEQSNKRVSYGNANFRFFDYCIGGSVPGSGGPALGLGWEWRRFGEAVMSIEDLEEFRGGNLPEEGEEDEEWDDNWRLPREYFQDEGVIPKERREELLRTAGHRRLSIDLSCSQTNLLQASRRKNSRTKIATFIIEGFDVDEMYQLDREIDAANVISIWAIGWLKADQPV